MDTTEFQAVILKILFLPFLGGLGMVWLFDMYDELKGKK